jgi:hypothetical protein
MERKRGSRRGKFSAPIAERVGMGEEPVDGNSATRDSGPALRQRSILNFTFTKALFFLLIVSLPLVNPWVHGDGVGYYAYARSLLIQHNLQFEDDWRVSNASFAMDRVDSNGAISPDQYTVTHHLDNHFTVGPAILWAPFLILVHLVVVSLNHLGAHFVTNGFTRPYVITIALATVAYGFSGLLLSFNLARRFVAERWAFLATVGYWFASSLPVYMYLNPSWSHALSLFTVALFLWYWHRTRDHRSWGQWCVLGFLAALMVNVYYLNAILLLVPTVEAALDYAPRVRNRRTTGVSLVHLAGSHVLFVVLFMIGMLPTLATRKIIYGSFLATGYPGAREWNWAHPLFWTVLFSSDHGLLSWTPILVLAVVGIIMFRRYDSSFSLYLWLVCAFFYYVICCYNNWDGLSSFGNRFFLSLGPIFILGLAVFFARVGAWWKSERIVLLGVAFALFLFATWNIEFIFQWGDHLIPVRGPISWRTMVYNQFCVVPEKIWETGEAFLFSRKRLLREIEQKDMQELRK